MASTKLSGKASPKKPPKKIVNLQNLLAKGYLPIEIPPPFTSVPFAMVAEKYDGLIKPNFISTCEKYSDKRIGHSRRLFKIPNPINHYNISKAISDNWGQIEGKLKQSPFLDITKYLTQDDARSLIKIKFHEFEEKRITLPAIYKYILKTDISKFYPTIYTHSIAWALKDKATAKKERYDDTLGNLLDKFARNSQDGQTLGLPIGPDTSRLIAELIMVAIDNLLIEKYGKEITGFRLIDDYFLCFHSQSQAQKALSMLAASANEFELAINEEKTSIIPTDAWVESLWKEELQETSLKGGAERLSLKNYINRTFHLAKSHPRSNVLKYAVLHSTTWEIKEDDWGIYEAFLLRAIVSQPNVIEHVAGILEAYKKKEFPIDEEKISLLCNNIILTNASLGNHSEVAWSLWLLKMFNLKLSKEVLGGLSNLESSVCTLLALDLRDKGQIDGKLITTKWESYISSVDGLSSSMWMMVYETYRHGWFPEKDFKVFTKKHEFFQKLIDENVYFYDDEITMEALDIGDTILEGDYD